MNYEQLRRHAEMLKKQYPPGTRVELIMMNDSIAPVPPGTRGTVNFVDDIGTAHCVWDNGRTLGLAAGEDVFRALTQEEIQKEQQAQITVKSIGIEELTKMMDKEGLIIQGCGGDLKEWVTGINQMLTDEGTLRGGSTFKEVSTFEYDGLTHLLFPFENADLNMGKLAMWRLNTHSQLHGVWLSDLLYNVFDISEDEPELEEDVDSDSGIYREPETLEDKIQAEIKRIGAASDHAAIHRVREYMSAVENGRPLVADGLQEGYRIICEYDGCVLAGLKYSGSEAAHGYQFATWDYSYDKSAVAHGHYYPTWSQEFGTRALEVAKLLADKNKPVALILCDMTAPMLPCICPGEDLENERSIGSLLAAAHPSEALVRHNAIKHKRYDNLMLFSLKKGENEMSCPRHTYEQAVELLRTIEGIATYVIVDCSSYISNDLLSSAVLMEADCVLRLSNHDLKSVSYFSSQLPLLKEANWDTEKQIKAASNITSEQKIQDTADGVLYHSPELAAQFQAGDLYENLSHRDSRAFGREIKKICREVFGC